MNTEKNVLFITGKQKKNVCEQYHNLQTLSQNKENNDKLPHIIYQPEIVHDFQKKVYKSKIACGKNDVNSYDISKICTYQLNSVNELIPCKSGGHLENCTHFECSMKYKCPGYYCIPWRYVCNGRWDCPHGIDESQEYNCVKERKCINMFKCKNSIICIHIGDICNEKIDCPLGDDEYLCDLKFTTCLANCSCLTFAIKCASVDQLRVDSSNNLPYHVIHIKECSEVFTIEFLQPLNSISVITMNGMFFDDICAIMPNSQHYITIDVSNNKVKRIPNDCFQQSSTLKVIKMNDNLISEVENKAFLNLKALTLLDLSHNIIIVLAPTIIVNCFELETIVIQNTSLKILDVHVFKKLGIKYLISDIYFPCCFIPSSSICLSPTSVSWYFSCTDLLVNNQIKMYFIIMAFIIICCNSFSFLIQVLSRHNHASLSVSTIVISSLNILDFSFGTYFLILWFADIYYCDRFAIVENKWKSSLVCSCAFSISLNFSFLYPVFLVLLALLRFWTVIKPMSTKSKDTHFIKRLLILLSSISIIVTIFVGYFMKSFHLEMLFKLCSPFLDPSDSIIIIIKVITLVIVNVQLICVIAIFVIYFLIVQHLRSYKSNFVEKVYTKKLHLSLYLQVCLVTVSNVFCWIPSGIIYVVIIVIDKYPINLIIWSTIALTPINSVINPIVFILANIRSHNGKLKRKIQQIICNR